MRDAAPLFSNVASLRTSTAFDTFCADFSAVAIPAPEQLHILRRDAAGRLKPSHRNIRIVFEHLLRLLAYVEAKKQTASRLLLHDPFDQLRVLIVLLQKVLRKVA